MAHLTMDRILRENHNREAASVISLQLSHRALSDVTLLSSFKNLERLDLTANCLNTLEALSSCVNLKWLSVVENKLKSLRGIEGLLKLTVLNAGKNKLQKMDEVCSLTSLKALILNDNNITSICNLDQLKYLNTLVLSRNPICDIGDSLVKVKALTKLSLSHCQIQVIRSSLRSCVDLKELRLSHNQITSFPAELGRNVKLQNLDIGNNLIEKWSDLKALSALSNLKSLNLQGNPVAENDRLANKVRKLLPNLRILNGRPIEKARLTERLFPNEDMLSHIKDDRPRDDSTDIGAKKKMKRKSSETDVVKLPGGDASKSFDEDEAAALPSSPVAEEKEDAKRNGSKSTRKSLKENILSQPDGGGNPKAVKKPKKERSWEEESDPVMEGEIKWKNSNKTSAKDAKKPRSFGGAGDLEATKESAGGEGNRSEGIDDAETPFLDLILADNIHEGTNRKKNIHEIASDAKSFQGLVIDHTKKKKKAKSTKAIGNGQLSLRLLQPDSDIGTGGLSTWDD
ncbi:putative leucine-rich repeat domain superfamily [Dioscorea sansibarensis]